MNGNIALRLLLKYRAFKTVKSNFWVCILTSVAYFALVTLITLTAMATAKYISADQTTALGIYVLFFIIGVLIVSPVFVGIIRYYTALTENDRIGLSVVFSGYTDWHFFFNSAGLTFLLILIAFAAPFVLAAFLFILQKAFMWVLGGIAFRIAQVISYFFSLILMLAAAVFFLSIFNALFSAFFVLSENHNRNPLSCIAQSFRVLFGSHWELFKIIISFFPWFLMTFITFGIVWLILFPYLTITYILYYRAQTELNGKKPKLPEYMLSSYYESQDENTSENTEENNEA